MIDSMYMTTRLRLFPFQKACAFRYEKAFDREEEEESQVNLNIKQHQRCVWFIFNNASMNASTLTFRTNNI